MRYREKEKGCEKEGWRKEERKIMERRKREM